MFENCGVTMAPVGGLTIIIVVVVIMLNELYVLHALKERTETFSALSGKIRAPAYPVGTLLLLQGGKRAKRGRRGQREKKTVCAKN